eukprot:3733069-Amphidinium_carterae.1
MFAKTHAFSSVLILVPTEGKVYNNGASQITIRLKVLCIPEKVWYSWRVSRTTVVKPEYTLIRLCVGDRFKRSARPRSSSDHINKTHHIA